MGINLADPSTLLGILFLAVVAIFIFVFNALSMRRTQLDRSIHHIREILRHRSSMLGISFDDSAPVAELLAKDAAAIYEGSEEGRKDFEELGELLVETLNTARTQLEDYNRIVENSGFAKIAKLLHYTPRTPF